MSYFQRTDHRQEEDLGPDWGFMAFIIIITAIAAALVLIQIYRQ